MMATDYTLNLETIVASGSYSNRKYKSVSALRREFICRDWQAAIEQSIEIANEYFADAFKDGWEIDYGKWMELFRHHRRVDISVKHVSGFSQESFALHLKEKI